jgi:hypothetical protein
MSETRPALPRRRFIQLLAASGAAVAAGVAPRAGAAQGAKRAGLPVPLSSAPTAAMRQELRKQEKSVADMLRVIRRYELPPGSPPASTFRAMRARRGDR